MAVKVGVSLWVAATDQQRAPARETQARDFERKIGLGDHPPTSNENAGRQRSEHTPSQYRLPHTEFSQLDPRRVVRSDSGDASKSKAAGTIELYALGTYAGHHLSYLPDGFLTEQGIHGVVPVGVEQSHAAPLSSVLMASAGSFTSSEVLIRNPYGQSGEPVGLEPQEAGSSPSRPLLSYLTLKWPDRQFHFLPRDQGVELFVRDYQLTPQERDELIDELSRRAPSMPERPQQIWLNGQEIWRASPLSNDYTGEHHGR
ncbi:hypothetical protein FBY06_14715 [Pseudomonas sp. SJZ085]|uniref:hypothetical protein n=1 Tax=unclassified Pseudomonas TaxID=196821 RepID=UPI00119A09EA|nr:MULTISPECIES: hypothetical protein [unclassified Pseudomonas]TWC11292.1 hypothetical protein FBX99_14715 [Pseudomonas sp. SJZ074]TWC29811.1 hypothetical protein FBY06_14715 [Pseudomonas sp. SJZ085]